LAAAVLALLCAIATEVHGADGACSTAGDLDAAAGLAALAATRAEIALACPCGAYDGSPGRGRGAYLRCASSVVDARFAAGALPPRCRARVRRLTAASVCGRRRAAGVAPCVRRSTDDGAVSCAIRVVEQCSDRAGAELEPCGGFTHCIDAADSNGDLRLDERDAGGCNPFPSPPPLPPAPTPASTPVVAQPFPTGADGERLAALVNAYRVANGKAPIPTTPTLMAVAGAHVDDLLRHPEMLSATCTLHSWSTGSGLWSGCCYDAAHGQASCMWRKPSELASALGYARYAGDGFELVYRGLPATPEGVLDAFTRSSAHRAVLLNQQPWTSYDPFPAMGAAIRGDVATVWFGSAEDLQK
jgi:hypothetical protein